jgi:homoserine dehydrogenase
MPDTVTYRLALIGFGSVGRGLAEIVHRYSDRLRHRYGCDLRIVAVATRRWGAYNPQGLDPGALLDVAGTGMFEQMPFRRMWSGSELIEQAEADVLVEVSPTDLVTGEPATGYLRAAIGRGLHIVTANKGPLALHGRELQSLAHAAGVGFGFEATVMSGTPALRLGWSDLAGCELREVRGIVNGTTNYILTQMDAGQPYVAALAEAQRLGYAETDPAGDVEGHDAAGKAVILANMLMDGDLRPVDVDRTGITGLTSADVAAARAAGERWKLIARVARENGRVVASVQPTRLPVDHPLASVTGATNAITFTTDLLGDVTLIGPGAGGVATGFGLVADILAMHSARK